MKRTILYLSILVSIFWICSRFVNVYRFALVGAIFEILWLPMIVMLFFLPLIAPTINAHCLESQIIDTVEAFYNQYILILNNKCI